MRAFCCSSGPLGQFPVVGLAPRPSSRKILLALSTERPLRQVRQSYNGRRDDVCPTQRDSNFQLTPSSIKQNIICFARERLAFIDQRWKSQQERGQVVATDSASRRASCSGKLLFRLIWQTARRRERSRRRRARKEHRVPHN